MQNKINPMIAVAAAAVIIALGIFFYLRSGRSTASGGGTAVYNPGYSTQSGSANHP